MGRLQHQVECRPDNGDLPDMSTAQGTGEVVEMMNADVLTPIDDMVDDIGRDRFSANALADMTSDGATYGVPYYSHAQVMWYRTDLLKQPAGSPQDLGRVL